MFSLAFITMFAIENALHFNVLIIFLVHRSLAFFFIIFDPPFLTVLASFTYAKTRTRNTTLVALTVFFKATWFLTMAPFGVESLFWLNFWFEGVWIPVQDRVYSHLSVLVILHIRAVLTVAVWSTSLSKSEAVAVKFEASRFLTVAGHFIWVNWLSFRLKFSLTGLGLWLWYFTFGWAEHWDPWLMLMVKIHMLLNLLSMNLFLQLVLLCTLVWASLWVSELIRLLLLARLLECSLHSTILWVLPLIL